MTQTLTIGPCPAEEEPTQLGQTPDFARLNRLEVDCYQAALVAFYGPPPEGAAFRHEVSTHDFGRYVELAIAFADDDHDHDAANYAFRVEEGLARWIDAGFTAPVDYPTSKTPRLHHANVASAVSAAVSIMRPPFPDGDRMIANLRAHYPRHTA